MARIKDVAKKAGVSVASVSRVLAGQPGVGAQTRERILATIREMEYRPDLAARRLRSRRTDILGLIVADIRNPFFTDVSRAVEDVAYQRGLRVMYCNADEDPAKETLYLEMMRDENVSGVILSPTQSLLERFRSSDFGFPIVLVDRALPDTQADAVVVDNAESTERLVRHMIETGRRRILFLYGEASATGSERYEGYAAAMRAAGLELAAHGLPPTGEGALDLTRALLAAARRPEAIVCSNGPILLGLIEAIREAGLRVPQDLAVSVFDDPFWARLVQPAVTAVAQPTYEIGRAAIELLLSRIANPGQEFRRVVLPGELVVRESSARV
ncbi:LacI family DNA-binding transcriptional regulator [Niveibacterium sp. SC-1]|uniref:LacI family DNA-binding transcriptional regulator n=1 Tax=Niveibacterium sp. SC-1 TaxID=3135646 RepID=UPI00311DA621